MRDAFRVGNFIGDKIFREVFGFLWNTVLGENKWTGYYDEKKKKRKILISSEFQFLGDDTLFLVTEREKEREFNIETKEFF